MLSIHSLALSLSQKEEEGCLTPTLRALVWGSRQLLSGLESTSAEISKGKRPGLGRAMEQHLEEVSGIGHEPHFHIDKDVGEVPIHHTWVSWEPGWSRLQRDLAHEVYHRESRGVEAPCRGREFVLLSGQSTPHHRTGHWGFPAGECPGNHNMYPQGRPMSGFVNIKGRS